MARAKTPNEASVMDLDASALGACGAPRIARPASLPPTPPRGGEAPVRGVPTNDDLAAVECSLTPAPPAPFAPPPPLLRPPPVDASDDACEDAFEIGPAPDQDEATMKFDAIVGALEAFMITDDFASTQAAFCRAECAIFEDTDENKLEYTPIFEGYVDALETAIEAHLASAVPGFDMLEFAEMLEARRETEALDGDAFELLATLSDFDAFKELMIAHKAEREALDARDAAGLDSAGVGLSAGVLSVGSVGDGGDGGDGSASNRHRRGGLLELGVGVGFGVSAEAAAAPAAGTDEQTDGEERPDLDDALIVTHAGAGGE